MLVWFIRRCGAVALIFLSFTAVSAAEKSAGGTLFVIGGGLRPDNGVVVRRMIEAAGGVEKCRFGVFPTASKSTTTAERFVDVLKTYGVAADRVKLLDVRVEGSAHTAEDPEVVREIDACTAAYFTGGDQQRITRAFLQADGSDTPALAALRRLWARGGIIGGTSAGAAMQSATMIGVGGLPDDALDEGMDALDFGLTDNPNRRGLVVSKGLGFFTAGIIDQHFSQYRGRLGRLARATVERDVRYGFGVDENTAMVVTPDKVIEVLGADCVTIVDAEKAELVDGPDGCRIDGLRVSCLMTGDRFDPQTGRVTVHAGKRPADPDDLSHRGNHLITDIAAAGAVPYALFEGLSDNTSRKLVGISLRYHDAFAHGYRLTFRKTETTQCWNGYVDNLYSHAVHAVDLSIEPILSSFQSPDAACPIDLPDGAAGTACRALWFRGILAADAERKLRVDAPLTRVELAKALAHTVHLLPPRTALTTPSDVSESETWFDAVERVLAAKLMEVDEENRFRPSDVVSSREARDVLARAARFAGSEAAKHESDVGEAGDDDEKPLTRGAAAIALYRVLQLPW